MISIDDQKLFEQYYQAEYDFNTMSLGIGDVVEIKALVKEKRVNYALAPIGEKIFELIQGQNSNIRFELIDFDSDKIDGMLYIPHSGKDKAYIVLNSQKPFINQIFASAHEYYHYLKDYSQIKETPYICCFNVLKDVNEKRASRFAAEFLLPEEALRSEVRNYQNQGWRLGQKLEFQDYAALCMILTVKYQIPLKAVIYRLYEEGYVKDVSKFIKNYDVIKQFLQELKIFGSQVDYLYSNGNQYLQINNLLYQQIKIVYEAGYASREEILRDAGVLNLDLDVIEGFFDEISTEDEEEDDAEMIGVIKELWKKPE